MLSRNREGTQNRIDGKGNTSETQLILPDKAGQLVIVTTLLADAKVNISAMCVYGMQDEEPPVSLRHPAPGYYN